MLENATYPSKLKAAFIAAALAWFALQALNLIHTDNLDHAEQASNHCIICTHTALDDDLETTPPASFYFEPIVNAEPNELVNFRPFFTLLIISVTARAPPTL